MKPDFTLGLLILLCGIFITMLFYGMFSTMKHNEDTMVKMYQQETIRLETLLKNFEHLPEDKKTHLIEKLEKLLDKSIPKER